MLELGIIACLGYLLYQYPEEAILIIFIGILLILIFAFIANREELT